MLEIKVELPDLKWMMEPFTPKTQLGSFTSLVKGGTEILMFGYRNGKCGLWISKAGIHMDTGNIREVVPFFLEEKKMLKPGEKYVHKFINTKGQQVKLTFQRSHDL